MDKPDVDSIEGLSPAISIDQKTTSRNPRSTVGTVTEIYDYLRLLWSRVGKPHCHDLRRADRRPVGRADRRPGDGARGGRAVHGARAGRPRAQGRVRQAASRSCAARASRAWSTASCGCSRRTIALDKRYKHDIAVVVDRLVMRAEVRKRLADSIETAVGLADGLVEVRECCRRATRRDGPSERTMLLLGGSRASPCGTSMPELEPRIFSFNSPHGACSAARAWARRWRSTRSSSSPIRTCRSTRARSRRGRTAPRTTTSR